MVSAVAELIALGLEPSLRPAVIDAFEAGAAAAKLRWPAGPELDADFARFVGERLLREPNLVQKLPRLQVADLYLVWWACSTDPAGIVAFEAAHGSQVDRLAGRFPKLQKSELVQALRIKLFVGTETAAPRLREFSGFGQLQNWLKVTAVRTFLDAARSARARHVEEQLDDEILDVAGPATDPRNAHQRAEVGSAVKRAFGLAVARLAPRERTFLRHASVDGLTLDQIAAQYGVHRATVARTLSIARKRLIETTRAAVVAELGLASTELDSAIRVLDSKLDLSLSRVLRDQSVP